MSTITASAKQGARRAVKLDGNSLTLEDLEAVARNEATVMFTEEAVEQIKASRAVIERMLEERQVVYGVTTGFGKFKDIYIAPEDSIALQRNFMVSHACGVGPAFDVPTTRAIMLLRANALAKGFSGIRLEVVQLLLDMLNNGVHPVIPQQGSVGASGDLAPLAHLALVLIGEGRAGVDGELLSGREALAAKGLSPVVLRAKEGLALTNGTQAMTALGALVVLEAERMAKTADIIGAMSLEAMLGSRKAFIEQIHMARPHAGQLASARNLRALLDNSTLMESHANCPMVQDAYSLRCMPQVHGASRQAFSHARSVIETEINSATDNPLVFKDMVLSGGNFHGQPIALVMDYVSAALAELANISERRTERLVNPALSNGLPTFLTLRGGLNSGFMVAQYTAAALVSENKSLAHPASVDSIPTSANQEDHVSMGTIAARKASAILQNLRNVLGIEMLCAAQGIDFRIGAYKTRDADPVQFCHDTIGLLPGKGVAAAHEVVRRAVPHLYEDRELHLDILEAERLIASGSLLQAAEQTVGALA